MHALRTILCLMLMHLMADASAQTFVAEKIPDKVWDRMQGRSYPDNCNVPREELRYLQMSHFDFNGQEHVGQMICHRNIAEDLLFIFRKLYEAKYPIATMRLIDEYEASDSLSMMANNTYCFCYRYVANSKKLSKHSMGMAVDINPLYNPCLYVRSGKVMPPEGEAYAYNRITRKDIPGKIDTSDLCYRLFISRGFRWGGHWRSLKDYHHFETGN